MGEDAARKVAAERLLDVVRKTARNSAGHDRGRTRGGRERGRRERSPSGGAKCSRRPPRGRAAGRRASMLLRRCPRTWGGQLGDCRAQGGANDFMDLARHVGGGRHLPSWRRQLRAPGDLRQRGSGARVRPGSCCSLDLLARARAPAAVHPPRTVHASTPREGTDRTFAHLFDLVGESSNGAASLPRPCLRGQGALALGAATATARAPCLSARGRASGTAS